MEEMKVCPFCGKEILAVAKMCKYCREWLPEEPANTAGHTKTEQPLKKESANTEECAQEENSAAEEPVQIAKLSSEERNARIEELKNEKKRLEKYLIGQIGRDRAEKEGLDINEIRCKVKEIRSELHKLDVEKGLEEGYWVRTEDGTIISNKKIDFPYHPYRPFVLVGIAMIAIIAVIIFLTHR